MIPAAMIYGLIVAVLVGAAAWFFDRGLRAVGRPTRWIWFGALGIGGLAPFIPQLLPTAPLGGSGPFILPVGALYELGTTAPPLSEQGGNLLARIGMDNPLETLWIIGSILVVAFFALICLRLGRLRTTWRPRDVCGEEVLRSDRFGPAVVGLFRPRIVLPSWTLGLDERELEMVVLHEQEHVRARDPALLAAGLLLASISPWNPAVWWALARLRLAVEGDCDRRVLARGIPPRSYARLLLTVAAGCRRTPDPAPALIRGGHSVIERRLMMIRNATRKPRIRASILTAAAGLGLFALACDTPVPQGPGELEPPTPSQATIIPAAAVGPAAIAGPEAGIVYVDDDGILRSLKPEEVVGLGPGDGLYVDEDGTLQAVEVEVEAVAERLRRTLEAFRSARGSLESGLRAGDIGEEVLPRDLWLELGSATESLRELTRESFEEMATELAMEVRRLQVAVEAGEITHEEAEQRLQTHMGARDVRLRWPDRPR